MGVYNKLLLRVVAMAFGNFITLGVYLCTCHTYMHTHCTHYEFVITDYDDDYY